MESRLEGPVVHHHWVSFSSKNFQSGWDERMLKLLVMELIRLIVFLGACVRLRLWAWVLQIQQRLLALFRLCLCFSLLGKHITPMFFT